MTDSVHLRVKSKRSQNAVLRDVETTWNVKRLLAELSTLTGVPASRMVLKTGFPPKRLEFGEDTTVQELGLRTQDTLIVEEESAGTLSTISQNGKAFAANVPVATGAGRTEAAVASGNAAALKAVASRAGTSTNAARTESGGVKTTESADDVSVESNPSSDDLIMFGSDDNGLMLRHVVPSDNSCLFTSVTYCLSGGGVRNPSTGGPAVLREMIARTVASDPIKYNDAYLGRTNAEYVEWIKKSESWGGGIELAILADFYHMQITVIDTQSMHISCFGEDQNYTQRMFLIYDGIHYDPLYFEPFSGAETRTIFPTANTLMMDMAKQLGEEARASNQFTDLKNFSLRCQVCNTLLKGQEEAQAHAKKTTHTAFAEIVQKK